MGQGCTLSYCSPFQLWQARPSSVSSLPQCPVRAFIHLSYTVFSSESLVSALWQSVIDLFLCILLERACSADMLSLQKVICWLFKVISSSAACLMAVVQ